MSLEVDWAATYECGIEALRHRSHDLCLFDYRLGARDGLELIREAKRMGCDAPIILLTGQGDEEVGVRAVKAGAADYLAKDDIDTPLLGRSIRYTIERERTLKALRQAERFSTMGQTAAAVSHHMKNILTRMIGSLDYIGHNLSEANLDNLNVMWEVFQRATHDLTTLAEDMLALAKGHEPVLSPVCLNSVATKICKLCKSDAAVQGIKLELNVSPDLPTVYGEETGILEVILNLVCNAQDACVESDGDRVVINTAVESGGERVMLSVRDNGPGIPKELQARIFEPFFSTRGRAEPVWGWPLPRSRWMNTVGRSSWNRRRAARPLPFTFRPQADSKKTEIMARWQDGNRVESRNDPQRNQAALFTLLPSSWDSTGRRRVSRNSINAS